MVTGPALKAKVDPIWVHPFDMVTDVVFPVVPDKIATVPAPSIVMKDTVDDEKPPPNVSVLPAPTVIVSGL
jgi:hypothetical protein